jgi:hypothetical protein
MARCWRAFASPTTPRLPANETIKMQGRFIAKKILNPATNTLVVVDVKPHPAVRHSRGGREIFKARPSLKILLDTADL